MNKELIAEREIKGGLNTTTQLYRIYYLPQTEINKVNYTPKISIEHFIKSDGYVKPTSLRFHTYESLLDFCGHLIHAYLIFKSRNNELNDMKLEVQKINTQLGHHIKNWRGYGQT